MLFLYLATIKENKSAWLGLYYNKPDDLKMAQQVKSKSEHQSEKVSY